MKIFRPEEENFLDSLEIYFFGTRYPYFDEFNTDKKRVIKNAPLIIPETDANRHFDALVDVAIIMMELNEDCQSAIKKIKHIRRAEDVFLKQKQRMTDNLMKLSKEMFFNVREYLKNKNREAPDQDLLDIAPTIAKSILQQYCFVDTRRKFLKNRLADLHKIRERKIVAQKKTAKLDNEKLTIEDNASLTLDEVQSLINITHSYLEKGNFHWVITPSAIEKACDIKELEAYARSLSKGRFKNKHRFETIFSLFKLIKDCSALSNELIFDSIAECLGQIGISINADTVRGYYNTRESQFRKAYFEFAEASSH